MRAIPGYRILQRLDGTPHEACWHAVREADQRAVLLSVNGVHYAHAEELDATQAQLEALRGLDGARLRLPRRAFVDGERMVVELDASRAELGQRAMLRLAQRLGLSLRRTPQEAARLTLALIRALGQLDRALSSDHSDADRVLLGADGRLRFDPVVAPVVDRGRAMSRLVPLPALDDLTLEHVRGQPLDARTSVCFAGLMLCRLGTGGDPRPGADSNIALLHVILTDAFTPEAQRLRAAPGVGAVAARATASDPDARYADLDALARALHAQAAACEDTFPAHDAPAPSSPAQLLEGLRASLNAGHLSAALAHLDLAPADIYDHPSVRDYVRHHAQRAGLDAIAAADLYTPRPPDAVPLVDWAALHLAAQHPAVRARFLADSLGRAEAEAEAPRARLSLWAAGRQPAHAPEP